MTSQLVAQGAHVELPHDRLRVVDVGDGARGVFRTSTAASSSTRVRVSSTTRRRGWRRDRHGCATSSAYRQCIDAGAGLVTFSGDKTARGPAGRDRGRPPRPRRPRAGRIRWHARCAPTSSRSPRFRPSPQAIPLGRRNRHPVLADGMRTPSMPCASEPRLDRDACAGVKVGRHRRGWRAEARCPAERSRRAASRSSRRRRRRRSRAHGASPLRPNRRAALPTAPWSSNLRTVDPADDAHLVAALARAAR